MKNKERKPVTPWRKNISYLNKFIIAVFLALITVSYGLVWLKGGFMW